MKRRQFIQSVAGAALVAVGGVKLDEESSIQITGYMEVGDIFTIDRYFYFDQESQKYDDSRLQPFEVTATDNGNIQMKALV